MQFDQYALVARARAGDKSVRPALFDITRLGFAYVGEAYLKGLRDPRGGQMLKDATAEQKDWPADRKAASTSPNRASARRKRSAGSLWRPISSNLARAAS